MHIVTSFDVPFGVSPAIVTKNQEAHAHARDPCHDNPMKFMHV